MVSAIMVFVSLFLQLFALAVRIAFRCYLWIGIGIVIALNWYLNKYQGGFFTTFPDCSENTFYIIMGIIILLPTIIVYGFKIRALFSNRIPKDVKSKINLHQKEQYEKKQMVLKLAEKMDMQDIADVMNLDINEVDAIINNKRITRIVNFNE